MAGDPRRWRDDCEHLAVVCAAADPRPVFTRFVELPQIVALLSAEERRVVGLTVEGVPVELVVAAPERFGTALVECTGAAAWVDTLRPLPDAPDEAGVFRALGIPWRPPELREAGAAATPRLLELDDIRGDLHSHTTWSDGRASVEEMGRAARDRGYAYLAICDHTPAVGAVQGLSADDVRRQAEEIAAANAALAPFRVLRGIECDILPDGRLDLPDDVLAELDWVQASVHGGQRMPARQMTDRVLEALRNPYVRCLSHPTGRYINRRPENALDLDQVFEVALEHDVAHRDQRAPDSPRPECRTRPRRHPGRNHAGLLDGRALARVAQEHAVRRRDGTPRRGDARRRAEHPPGDQPVNVQRSADSARTPRRVSSATGTARTRRRSTSLEGSARISTSHTRVGDSHGTGGADERNPEYAGDGANGNAARAPAADRGGNVRFHVRDLFAIAAVEDVVRPAPARYELLADLADRAQAGVDEFAAGPRVEPRPHVEVHQRDGARFFGVEADAHVGASHTLAHVTERFRVREREFVDVDVGQRRRHRRAAPPRHDEPVVLIEIDLRHTACRVTPASRYSFSNRARSGVPRFHSSQNASRAASNSASRPVRAALARAAIVGPQ